MADPTRFRSRIATEDDVPAIIELMRASIAVNMRAFLTEAEIKAAQETMGVDNSLISDRTYFVIETDKDGDTVMVACGGWGKRRTLYGGDHSPGRDDRGGSVCLNRFRSLYKWISALGVMPQPGLAAAR